MATRTQSAIRTQSTFAFNHLADAFIQSDLQMRTMEAIKINKRTMIWSAITSLSIFNLKRSALFTSQTINNFNKCSTGNIYISIIQQKTGLYNLHRLTMLLGNAINRIFRIRWGNVTSQKVLDVIFGFWHSGECFPLSELFKHCIFGKKKIQLNPIENAVAFGC